VTGVTAGFLGDFRVINGAALGSLAISVELSKVFREKSFAMVRILCEISELWWLMIWKWKVIMGVEDMIVPTAWADRQNQAFRYPVQGRQRANR
jgi:hypothetical protein